MRNLKRALSLTLASVMLLGMMVVGSSAAVGYDDVADTDNVEAIEVLQAIEVMVGDERGFGPERPVNRAEMAVVMGKLLSLDYNYYEATCPFNDVYDWARGWVGACYANGIVSGRGEGVYDPGTTVTAVEAASMLMRALGYFKYQSDYANGFEVATVSQATKIRLFDGVNSKTNEPLTRNQVAQMALNALKTGVVEPDGNALNFVDSNGNVIATGGKINYVNVTSNKPFASAIGKVQATSVGSTNTGYIVDLGEQLYDGKLKLDDAIDDFGRPARRWEFDGKEIGSYAKKELMVFDNVGKVTGVDLYNLIGKATLDKYDLTVTVDGIDDFEVYDRIPYSLEDHVSNSCVIFDKTDLNRNNKAAIGGTGTGVLMQVFVDHETDDVYVAVINTYLARATKAYDDKKEEATIEVYALDKETQTGMYGKTDRDYDKKSTYSESFTLGNEDFSLVKDIEKDDPFLVTVAQGKIQSIEPAEVLSDVAISSFKKLDYVVSGGTQYNYTTTADYNYEDLYFYTSEDDVAVNLKEITYNIFLDAYGNLIGLEANEKPNNYVFLTSIDVNGSYISNKTATANAIFLDGTVDTISINMTKSTWRPNRSLTDIYGFTSDDGESLLNTWCTYSKSGDVYTIKEVWNVVEPDGDRDPMNDVAKDYRDPQSSKASGDEKANGTKLAQFRDVIGKFSSRDEITLKDGLRMYGGYTSGNSYYNVYGDSNSVYLTAEMGQVKNGNGVYGVIKGVETVHTGIDGTSITIWDEAAARAEAYKDLKISPMTEVAYGVYTLYNEKGIVIAAMVVGEGSSSSELVYVTSSDAKLESDNGGSGKAANDGLYTWTREVVRNGEIVDLTEVGDKIDEISRTNMDQYEWYQVKLDGNGNVVKAEPAFTALGYYEYIRDYNEANPDKPIAYGRDIFVSEYQNINNAVEIPSMTTVLYHTNNGPVTDMIEDSHTVYPCKHTGFNHKDELTVKGNNVLAVNTEAGSGIYFRNDVNVVLVYWNRNTKTTDVMLGEGVDDLKEMVDYVNENSKASVVRDGGRSAALGTTYYVSALIENGAATTIVIQDRYNPYAKPDHSTDIPSGEYTLTLGGIFNNTYTTVNNSDVYIVDKNTGNTTRLESIDDLGTATVNGFKRYEVPANATIRVLDKDLNADFVPYFSPVHPTAYYAYNGRNITGTTNPYIEFTMQGEDLIVRQWRVGDEFPISITGDVTVKRGTVTLKDGDAVKMDDVLTITFDAAKVDVTVNGDAFKSGDTYKVGTETELKIVAKDKTPVDPGKEAVKVTIPAAGYVNIYRDGNSISKVEGGKVAIEDIYVDDVITLEPAEALEFTAGVDAEGKVTGDITIAAKTGYNWNALFHMWMDPTGKGVPCTWITGAAVYSIPGARFSLARAVGDEIDVSEPNWVSKYVADEDAYFDITVDIGGGKTVTWNCHFMDMVPVMTFAEEYSDADQAAAWKVMADEAQIGTGIKVFEGEAGEEPVPPTPGEDVELKELESNTAKTVYTVNYHTDAKKPSAADIAAKIGTDTGYTIVGWRTGTNNGVLDATDANGKAVSVVVKWVAKTAIHYNGVIIAYVNKDDATKAAVGAGIFTEKTQVIGDTNPAAKVGTILPLDSNGKGGYTVTPVSGTTADDYYLLDAFKLAYDISGTVGEGKLTSVKYKLGGTLTPVNVGAGIAADSITLTIGGAQTAADGDEIHLRVNDTPVVKKYVTAADAGTLTYELTIKKTDAKDGEVEIGEYGPIFTVVLNDKTEKYYGYDGEAVKIKMPEGTSYIKATSTTDTLQWFDTATNTMTANEDGVLVYSVDGSNDIDVTGGKTITLNRAYKVEFSADVAAVDVVEAVADYDGTGSVATGNYVVPGKVVGLASANYDVTLSGANGLTLTEVESLRTTDADGKITYYYTFTMPERNVVKADIVEGDNHGKVKVVVGTVTPGTLNEADGNGAGTAVVTITNGPDTKDFPGTIAWYTDAKCTKPVTGNGGRPAGMTDCYAETTATDGKWTVHFLAEGLEPVKAGTYYFKVTVSNVSAIGRLTVAAYTSTANNLDSLEAELNMDGVDKITLQNPVDIDDANLTIPAGKTLTVTGNTNILTTSGTVTVEAGATLGLDDAAQVAALTGEVKLNGKLVIDDLATLPKLAKGSTGEIEFKGTTANTDVWAKRDMLVAGAATAAKAADGKILVTSANVTVSDITLSGDGEVSWAGEDQSVSDIIKAQGGGDCLRVFDFNIGKGWQTKKLTVQIEDYAGVKHDLTEVASIPAGNATEDLHLKVLLGSNVKSITFTVDPDGAPSIGTYEIINSGIRP